MINFSTYLIEAPEEQGKKLKHLTHLEDNVFHGGHEGVGIAAQHLEDVHNKLLGKNNSTMVTTKYDGSPSIVFGTHPETGKFFVASKSAFNKDPKINYTPEDIERNHGHAPGLVEKLKAALEHLPKIMPRTGGVYQGDLMYTKGDVQQKNGMRSVTPNTITYSAPNDSEHGKQMKIAQLGIVVHTKYSGGKKLENMGADALDPKTRASFGNHPDVHNINPTMDVNPQNYTPEEQHAFLTHAANVKKAYAGMKPEAMDAIAGHGPGLESHVNKMVREGGTPSVEGYLADLAEKSKKEVDKLKTPAAKEKKIQEYAKVAKQVTDNLPHFKKALEVHNHLQAAKNVLVNVMAKNSPFMHTIGGEATGPEGAVAVDKKGNMSKFVDRDEFSRQNFLKGKQGQLAKQRSESLKEEVGTKKILSFVRMNPIHQGHSLVVNKVADEANRTGASHEIILSHSHDAAKNPLTPEQKLKHARRAFPGVNFSTSSSSQPSLLHHLSKAHDEGHKEVTIVGGSDRDAMGEMAKKYNGVKGPHGYYNLKLNFVQAGGTRGENEGGVEGYSASKMRAAAAKNDLSSFSSMAPSSMKPAHVKDMFNDTRKGMQLKENTTAAIGGLGFNTGNPAADKDELAKYAQNNSKTTAQVNSAVAQQMNSSQNKLSSLIGFKAFVPGSTNSFDKALPYAAEDQNANPLLLDKARKRAR